MRKLLIVFLATCSVSALAEATDRSFIVVCSETLLSSGQAIEMIANYTFRAPVNDPTIALQVPFTPFKTNIVLHFDLTPNGESRIDAKISEENLTDDLATVSSALHLDGRDEVEFTYHTLRADISGVKVSCTVKPNP